MKKWAKYRYTKFRNFSIYILKIIGILFVLYVVILLLLMIIRPSNEPIMDNIYSDILKNSLEAVANYPKSNVVSNKTFLIGFGPYQMILNISNNDSAFNSNILCNHTFYIPINIKMPFIYLIFNCSAQEDCNQKNEDNNVGNLLTGAQNMIEFITLILGIVTVFFAVLGLKWIRYIKRLREITEEARSSVLRAASFTYHGLSDISKPQSVPDKYEQLLEKWYYLYIDEDMNSIINNRSEFACLRFAAALYLASTGKTDQAINIIENKIVNDLLIDDDQLLRGVYYRLAILYRGNGEYEKSWKMWEKVGDERDNTKIFGKYITLFAHMINFKSESFMALYEEYNHRWTTDDKTKKRLIKRFDYASDDLNVMLNRTFLVIFSCALLFPAKSYRLFLLPEFLYFLDNNKLSAEDWKNMILFIQDESNIQEVYDESIDSSVIKSLLDENSITVNTTLKECLNHFAKLVNDKKQLFFIPSEIDNDFQANLNYCFALINYYLLISQSSENAEAKASSLKYLAMAEHHANQSTYIFSEKKQADVKKDDFIKEIKYLRKAINSVT